MDFTLTDEQQLLRDTARSLLRDACPPSLVRAHMDDPSAADPLWPQLSGWLELGDGPLVDLCLFLEECGAGLVPGPFTASALARPVVGRSGSATVAMAGADGVWHPNGDVVKTFVLEADRVDTVVVVDAAGARLVDASACECRPVAMLDSTRRVFEVRAPSGGASVDLDAAAWVEHATVAISAELLGATRWIFEAARQYAKDRVQFDKPIGSFQAIQHKLADMALALERAWSAVYYAAMCVDAGDDDRHRAVHVAKAAAGAAATRNAKDGIQIHGGIGYTWEHNLHLYIRRVYANEHLLGTTGWHHDRLADLLLGAV
jgi:alkylation response protein AidB-like acyl-CoA dehydrogenase